MKPARVLNRIGRTEVIRVVCLISCDSWSVQPDRSARYGSDKSRRNPKPEPIITKERAKESGESINVQSSRAAMSLRGVW
jgi:hypothetical protein